MHLLFGLSLSQIYTLYFIENIIALKVN